MTAHIGTGVTPKLPRFNPRGAAKVISENDLNPQQAAVVNDVAIIANKVSTYDNVVPQNNPYLTADLHNQMGRVVVASQSDLNWREMPVKDLDAALDFSMDAEVSSFKAQGTVGNDQEQFEASYTQDSQGNTVTYKTLNGSVTLPSATGALFIDPEHIGTYRI